MKLIPVFILILNVPITYTKQKPQNVTLNVHARVALLKLQIAREIKQKRLAAERIQPIDKHDIVGSYEYVELGSIITPIMENDKRKKKGRYNLKQLKTTEDPDLTTNTPKMHKNIERSKYKNKKESSEDDRSQETEREPNNDAPVVDDSSKEERETQRDLDKVLGLLNMSPKENAMGSVKGKKGSAEDKNIKVNPIMLTKEHKRKKKKAKDSIFYRRYSGTYDNMNKKFVHCQDLITPFLSGIKTNMTEIKKKLTYKDRGVLRLIQLIGEDTTGFTTEEIYSILYQISDMQIRLFQWDIPSLKLLFNVVNRDNTKRHTFRSLKNGLKKTLTTWNINFTNTTNLLKQARLFRPPCVRMPGQDGSTKSSKSMRYTTPEKPRCSDDSDNSDCV